MSRLLYAAVLLAGCQSPPLSDPLSAADPLLSELPADAPLLIGGSPASLLTVAEQLDLLPIAPDLVEVTALAGACTGDGCALIATGDLARVPELSALSRRATRSLSDGVELVAPDGLAVQARWSGERLRIGHAAAVERLGAGARLDPATLAGAIPDGDLWLYARDQDALFSQASDWLASRQTAAADEALAALNEALASRPALAGQIDAVALSMVADARPEIRLWLHCADASSARQVHLALQAARSMSASRQPDPRIADALQAVTFTRADATVEAVFVDADGLALAIIEESRR